MCLAFGVGLSLGDCRTTCVALISAQSSMSARNAEPETVALAVLDVCERAAVAGREPDYDDEDNRDSQFMKSAIESIKSRLRVLKRQSAAGWRPEFTKMLDSCHSIAVERVDFMEKEGVRTQKMKCMACGRKEHCCKFALNGVGRFISSDFNEDNVCDLRGNFVRFMNEYMYITDDVRFINNIKEGHLDDCDFGEYTIGETCLRKAELYFLVNTLIMENCYEAYMEWQEEPYNAKDPGRERWLWANEENAKAFVQKLEQLELAIADEKRHVPMWGTDGNLWAKIDKARGKASADEEEERVELLRERAHQTLARFKKSLENRCEEEEEEESAVEVSDNESADEDGRGQPRGCKGGSSRRKSRRVLESEEERSDVEEPVPCVGKDKGKRIRSGNAPVHPVRKSRRQQNLSPEDIEVAAALSGMPRNEGEAVATVFEEEEEEEPTPTPAPTPAPSSTEAQNVTRLVGTRRPGPTAVSMARQQRVPGGRLPARQNALINLGTLQVRLLREARMDDAAICTNAMFVLQELMSRVSELQHSVEA